MKPVIVILSVCLAVSVLANAMFVLADKSKQASVKAVKEVEPPKSTKDIPANNIAKSDLRERSEWLKKEIQQRRVSIGDLEIISRAAIQDKATVTIKMIELLKRAKQSEIVTLAKEQKELVAKDPTYKPTSPESRKLREDLYKQRRALRPPRPVPVPKPGN